MKTTKCDELFRIDVQEVLENSELIELKGGANEASVLDPEGIEEPTGNCHGNGCNQTCKKRQ